MPGCQLYRIEASPEATFDNVDGPVVAPAESLGEF
jgi:hypothetical protein